MKVRTSIIAAGAAAVLGTTGALLVPAMASAHSTATTLTFISVTNKSVSFTKTTAGQQDTDVNAAGKTVGFDMVYFTITSKTAADLNLAVDTTGGLLYGTGTVNFKTGTARGTVTGGTGSFTGATGTITAKPANKSGTRTLVTIKYTT